jgi:signal peptidase I
MASLLYLMIWAILSVLLGGLVLGAAARALGSPRGRIVTGIAVALVLVILGIAFSIGINVGTTRNGMIDGLSGLFGFAAELCITFFILRRVFKLSRKRTLGLFGVYFLFSLAQWGFAMLVFRPYIAEAFFMPTAGMSPTIVPGDRFLVDKLRRPERWDLVAFRHSEAHGTFVYCKRVVGLPGDRLQFNGGNVFLNGRMLSAPQVVAGQYWAKVGHRIGLYEEGQTIQVGSDEIFVIGDNVPISADSRVWGPIKLSDVVGVAEFKYWPPHRMGMLQ